MCFASLHSPRLDKFAQIYHFTPNYRTISISFWSSSPVSFYCWNCIYICSKCSMEFTAIYLIETQFFFQCIHLADNILIGDVHRSSITELNAAFQIYRNQPFIEHSIRGKWCWKWGCRLRGDSNGFVAEYLTICKWIELFSMLISFYWIFICLNGRVNLRLKSICLCVMRIRGIIIILNTGKWKIWWILPRIA